MRNALIRSRGGFTLMEILVALVLIGLLTGALVPAVLNRLSTGESNRVAEDLNALSNAAQLFRTDVNRWPGDATHLMEAVVAGDQDVNDVAYPNGLLGRWRGPYLQRGDLTGGGLPTGFGGSVAAGFETRDWSNTNTNRYFVVLANDIAAADAETVSEQVDGDNNLNAGRVRWEAADATAGTPERLVFFAAPIQ